MTGGVGLPQIDSAKASGRKEYTSSYRRQTVDEQDFNRLATVATGKRSTAARLMTCPTMNWLPSLSCLSLSSLFVNLLCIRNAES